HFNLQAVRATLARVYLTQENIDSAYFYAAKVIQEGGFELVEKTEIAGDIIGTLSPKETIFGLYAKESFYTRTKGDLYDAISFKSLDPWNGIATVYQQGGGGNDYRWAAWFQTISQNLRCVKLTDPYQLTTGSKRPTGQIPGINLIRLPEMYYIAAECLLRKNDPAAADYFNAVLESRGLVALNDRIPAEPLTLEKITQERYKEFVGEGQTFFNMKRLNLDIQSITGEILPADNSIYTIPIPEEEFSYRNEIYDVEQ
ncbi:MAG: RagB/SusD family nutrient uptake outer membrane protein, partial [Odoribacter sp.]|nr:RagB/SusD family nutrient uptake outer membrane protein [Odoribacter sp.]